ncbi:MAG: acyltransferase [Selenomonadaceae bacterium]|nr:acyltransferase [Selenomonadaceae bacterium]
MNRLYFLDNLKWFIIWLMVVFHGAMCYMAYAPEWWYVVDTAQPVFSATVFICWVDIFIMPVMFFVSGYFGLKSLSRRSAGEFLGGKWPRIVCPWLFGSLCIAPFIAYLILASRNSPIGFWEFYTTLFWGPFYQQAHYWYLGALMALYILLLAAVAIFPSLRERSILSHVPSFGFFFLLFAVSFVSIGVIGSYMHPDTWRAYAYVLVLQPVRVPSYILIFFVGALAWRWQWFTLGGYVPSAKRWGIAFALLGPVYLWQKLFLPYTGIPQETLIWVNAFCQAAFMVAAVFFLLGFFHIFWNYTTPLLSSLSETSYAVYYVHQPILFCTAWAFVGISLNVYLKYLCVCTLSLAGCYLVSKYLMLRLPGFSKR